MWSTVLALCLQRVPIKSQSEVEPASIAAADRLYTTLRQALEGDDRSRVASLFRYPLQVRVLGLESRLVAVKDVRAMVELYPLFFGPAFRCSLETPRTFANGVLLLAGGKVIAQRVDGAFRITRLTVSLEAPRVIPGPTLVFFPYPKRERQFAGRLAHSQQDAYVVTARAGDRLEVRLERFRGRSLAMTVTKADTNHRLVGNAGEQARVWRASIPEDGQYRIEVQRRLKYCDPEVTYLLTIILQ